MIFTCTSTTEVHTVNTISFTDEDVFTVQILGEINGTTKEFIFKGSLKDAEKGGEDIARRWAFMKIYYLISRNTMGIGDPNRLRSMIDELSRKYNITTPYDIEDGYFGLEL